MGGVGASSDTENIRSVLYVNIRRLTCSYGLFLASERARGLDKYILDGIFLGRSNFNGEE